MTKYVAALLGIATLTVAAGARQTSTCDRPCLEAVVDRYLDAMIAHDPAKAPLATTIRVTENGQRLTVGDGSRRTMAGKGTYRLIVADAGAGQIAVIQTLREETRTPGDTVGVVAALRLRVTNRQISEAELFVVRNPQAAQSLDQLGTPHRLFLESVPAAERMTRANLIATANMYFSGMELNDGKGDYPFTDDCNRLENGAPSTNLPTPPGQTRPTMATASQYSSQWGCREQFESGFLHFVTRIRDRRFLAVDEERGIVFSFVFFDHAAGKTRTYQLPNGRSVTNGPPNPFTWELAELFKVERGKIRQIEAILAQAPYGMPSGWSTWEDGLSSRPQDVTGVGGRGSRAQ